MTESERKPRIIRHVPAGQVCCDPRWEAAYKLFETPEEEIAKFIRRLRRFGFDRLSKNIQIAEIFCGRGGGLTALERLGFQNLEGVDLSDALLSEYRGTATLHLADCMNLPMQDGSFDAVIVHGGLHHLPVIPDDVDKTLAEVARVLRSDGHFYAVEPWLTPFLKFVHFVTDQPIVRRLYAKGDALATMTEYERISYEKWLSHPQEILGTFAKHFESQTIETRFGKLMYVGRTKE